MLLWQARIEPMETFHKSRLEFQDFGKLAPDANTALLKLSGAAQASSLDRGLLELVKLRASQINGCGFCVAFHVDGAAKLGVSSEKLHMLAVWRETAAFNARERAALAWTEALTTIAGGVTDELYTAVREAFSDRELALLSSIIVAINAWNRLGVAYRFTPPAIAAPALKAAS
jgi:AhpD family alkylhydroperoxidase